MAQITPQQARDKAREARRWLPLFREGIKLLDEFGVVFPTGDLASKATNLFCIFTTFYLGILLQKLIERDFYLSWEMGLST